MNRFTPKLLRVLIVSVLLPLSGFGQMLPETAGNLQRSINALQVKIGILQNQQGLADDPASRLFLQKLKRLLYNLREISRRANTSTGRLNVATIRRYLHTNLQQSAFTDANGAHTANVFPAVAPMSPFTVGTGKSSYQAFSLTVPLHQSVNSIAPGAALQYPPINNVAVIRGFKTQAAAALLHPNLIPPIPTQAQVENAIEEYANCFSNGIVLRQLHGGEVIVRCCQGGASEPGSWWVSLQDFPLSLQQLRENLANLPNWNQDGNLEFFVVPEECNITVLEGVVAAQQLNGGNLRYFQLRGGEHYERNFLNNVSQRVEVTKNYLQGGAKTQIYVLLNGSYSNHNVGIAFSNANVDYIPCLAIIPTGWDVELAIN
ncbi:MAG: hypothetical protein LBG98_01885 [Puniceicoccales bacterium]|jgi:hypothetical protein|nr:hypothetical protein [Puniceicoccales bacterium]